MTYHQPPLFRCRCSAIGQLMSNGRSKSETLSETAKSMLTLWYKEQLYQRRKEIVSKYMTKGNTVEDESITYLNSIYGTNWKKNETYYEDEYIHGTPDVLEDKTVIDIKSSWSFDTFPLFSSSLPNKDYYAQVQGYLHLTSRKQGSVIYTLMDTPDDLIVQEWRSGGNYNVPVTDEFKANYKYGNITDSALRVKRFDFEYDQDYVNQIIDRVVEARQFISNLKY